MLTSVEFDHQRRLSACEISDVGTNRKLPYEFEATKLPISKQLPQDMLGVGFLASKRASPRG